MTKTCTKCQSEKEASEFYKDSRNSDGLRSWCKVCSIKSDKSWQKRNPEKYATNNENWRNRHKEDLKEKRKIYLSSEAGSEKVRETEAVWRKTSPKYKAKVLNRRIAKMNRTPEWAKNMMKDYMPLMIKFRNALSKRAGVRYEIDHIIPLQAKPVSGLHLPWNLQFLPASKNHSKQNKFELEKQGV